MSDIYYKIDEDKINERLIATKTRQDWLKKRKQLLLEISEKIKLQSVDMFSEIKIIQEKIDYIDEILERWYSSMCIRCGKYTDVETYCGTPSNCKHCITEWIHRALATLDEK